MQTEKINIILADDHNLIRDAIKDLLNQISFINVVGTVSNGDELIKNYFDSNPDLIITDIFMPNMNGIEAVKKIKKRDLDAKILFLSAYDDEEYIYECLTSGALGYVNKVTTVNNLLDAIKKVNKGERYYSGFSDERLNEIYEKYPNLTSSGIKITMVEHKILRLIGQGFSSEQIAHRLNLSKKTIDNHRAYLIKKLKLKGDLLRYAIHYNKIHGTDRTESA